MDLAKLLLRKSTGLCPTPRHRAQALLSQMAMVEAEHGFTQTSNPIHPTWPSQVGWLGDGHLILAGALCLFPGIFAFGAREGISECWMLRCHSGPSSVVMLLSQEKTGLQCERMKVKCKRSRDKRCSISVPDSKSQWRPDLSQLFPQQCCSALLWIR